MPFFILAGSILDHIGATRRLMKLAESLVGHLKGGLAHINVVASMFFAGITGSAVADTSAIGSLLIPAMIKQGYKADLVVFDSTTVRDQATYMEPLQYPSGIDYVLEYSFCLLMIIIISVHTRYRLIFFFRTIV